MLKNFPDFAKDTLFGALNLKRLHGLKSYTFKERITKNV